MMPRLLVTLAIAAVVGACVPPPPPDAWGAQAVATLGPLNSEPWVTTQYPPGYYWSTGLHQPFQTPNSLPQGAWNIP